MLWHALLLLFTPLASLIGRPVVDGGDCEVLALRQQVPIIQRQLGKRPRLFRADKVALPVACFQMKRQQLPGSLLIVKPDTVIGRHRHMVRRHWSFRQKRKPGRPPTDPEAQGPVVQIAQKNLRWGYTRIAGEVGKLGLGTIGRSTVERTLKRH